MSTEVTKIKVFVASPSDVLKERMAVDEVVKELNHSLGDEYRVTMEVVKWETHVHPQMGRPQGVIIDQTGQFDIFLGIMWNRFGSPTGEAESGTIEEFTRAYKIWEDNNDFPILFYFSKSPCYLETAKEAKQAEKVRLFKERLEKIGLYKEYANSDSFTDVIRPDLTKVIVDLAKKRDTFQHAISYSQIPQEQIKTLDSTQYEQMSVKINEDFFLYSSFIPNHNDYPFMQLKVRTTPGFYDKRWHGSNIILIRDPLRSCLIQIGETRSYRNIGNPDAVPELSNMELETLEEMYPFISSNHFKWIRMVIAELSTNHQILKYIYDNDKDEEVRTIAAKNPSGSDSLMSLGCKFCDDNFKDDRRLNEACSVSQLSMIIKNDFPYGPYFHYIAFPESRIHTWENLTQDLLNDLNILIWKFLSEKKSEMDNGLEQIKCSPGVNIGFNSTIRHLILTRRSKASAGASIAHVHKQIWGMMDGPVYLSQHLTRLCKHFESKGIDYLGRYLEELEKRGFVIWKDAHVALYVPLGQISVHELQAMVIGKGKSHFLSLTEDEVRSLSRAEFIAIQIFKKLKVGSFNEVMLTENLNSKTRNFRLVLSFVTREVDLAVSELNQLYVVDKHPQDTIKAILSHIVDIEKYCAINKHDNFGCVPDD